MEDVKLNIFVRDLKGHDDGHFMQINLVTNDQNNTINYYILLKYNDEANCLYNIFILISHFIHISFSFGGLSLYFDKRVRIWA